MRRSGWTLAQMAATVIVAAGCATQSADPAPEPSVPESEPGQDINFEGFPDTLELLLGAPDIPFHHQGFISREDPG